MYEVAVVFENTSYNIENIEFEIEKEIEDVPSGMGFSEGEIQYDMIFENGERKKIHGPFKIYFGRNGIYGPFIFSTWPDTICIQKKSNNFLLQ